MINRDSNATSKPNICLFLVMGTFILYAPSVGPVHGLYYTDHLSEGAWTTMKFFYLPLNLLENALPNGEPIHTYKYKWYIGIKFLRLPYGKGLP